jgi:hypothetical protein
MIAGAATPATGKRNRTIQPASANAEECCDSISKKVTIPAYRFTKSMPKGII